MKINQWFCFHIWKTKNQEELGNSSVNNQLLIYVHDYAIYQECIKCHKERIIKLWG